MTSDRVRRNIYFYRVEIERYDKSLDKKINIEEKEIDTLSQELMSKIPSGKEGFFESSTGGVSLQVDSIDQKYIKYRYVAIRKDALPFAESDGKIEELASRLEPHENLAEITHGVWFRKDNIIGVEFNSAGARARALTSYLREKVDPEKYYTVKLTPLIDPEPYSKLRRGEELSLLKLKMAGTFAGDQKAIDDASMFFGLRKMITEMMGTTDTIEVCIKKRKTKKNNGKGLKSHFSDPDFTRKFIEENKDQLDQFVISQEGTSDGIDLLNDKFVKQVTACRTKNRTLDTNDMYRGIISGFETDILLSL